MKKVVTILVAIALIAIMGTAAATGFVAGAVYGDDGTTPVPNAVVTAYNDSGFTAVDGSGTTNADGTYFIPLTSLMAGDTVYMRAESGSSSGTSSGVLNSIGYLLNFDLAIVNIQIPEFPTIALPIAAILGLAFIFQRRKEEE